jgi:hypothetical protein
VDQFSDTGSVASKAKEVRVVLLFKPFPLLPDEAAFVLGEWRVPAK